VGRLLIILLADGAHLAADPPRDDSVVTLDDVYEAVTGRPKGR
jgi:hypothetical protein